ncbi:Transposon Ty3-G Gag-Pol polyprotein [Rhizoctonia solani]|uniref:RNA-directed DNA polymerase n=1 Tax=Rhizoctonia solani TaxID=456999 RepID=A0A0K6G8S3_9AGAM|nr:Transposon Ty3-G Gag-Pol polyprotein [Rhizoctonia solani]
MFDRELRSGRVYDQGQPPDYPKRRTRKSQTKDEPEVAQTPETHVSETPVEPGNEVPAEEPAEELLALRGKGKRQSVTWTEDEGVKMSPSAYKALTNRPPPIRRPSKRHSIESTTSRPTTDARDHDDQEACGAINAAVAHGPVEALAEHRGNQIEADSHPPREAPGTPVKTESGLGLELVVDDSPSPDRTRKRPRLSGGGNDTTGSTKDATQSEPDISTWDQEVRRAEGSPSRANTLPDLNVEWYRERWSRSDYMSAPRNESSKRVSDDVESVRVNALIYEVDDNYVFSDGEYEEVVRDLGEQDRVREYLDGLNRNQTSGAGPSGVLRSPSIVDNDDIQSHIYISSDEQSEYTGKGKGKAVDKKKKKKRTKKSRLSLGVAIDDVQPKPDPDEPKRRTSAARNTSRIVNEVPDGFVSGGYAESRYGRSSEQVIGRSSERSTEQPTRSSVRSLRSVSRQYSRRSLSRSEVRQPSENELRRSTATRSHASRGRGNSPAPSESSSSSSDSDSSDEADDSDSGNESDSESDSSDTVTNNTEQEDCILRKIKKLQKINKQLKRKFKRQARSGYKAQAPKTYKGDEPDIEEYDQFLFDYDNWVVETGLSSEEAVQNVSRFLGGKAGRWYMAKIAPNLGKTKYKMKDVYKLMYQYCFPPDFKEKIRKKYEGLTQGDRSVQDFFAHLELYRTRLNDITDLQHGSSNNHTTNRERERSENWKKSKSSGNENRTNHKSNNEMTEAERERHRAEDRCFKCHKVGHMSRNCPSSNVAKPTGAKVNATTIKTTKPESKIRASSVMLKELDRLHDLRDKIEAKAAKVDVGSVQIHSLRSIKKPVESQGYIERNALKVKDNTRLVPQTVVVRAKLNGAIIRALLDSGSQADILSTTIVDQLKIDRVALTKPLQLQLAISGSKSMVNYGAQANLQYQAINEDRDFDVGNLDGFNPTGVVIGSVKPLPLEGEDVLRINSVSADVVESRITPLPPFRKINHRIPLIDPNLIYKFRPSKCPEKLRPLFDNKACEYLESGRWELTTGSNAIPMLFLVKKSDDGSVAIRTVLDKREQNDNTVKLASPLPLTKDVMLNVSRYPFKSVIDGKDAYEQIRVEEEDVPKTLFHTPMGTMVSLVMQQGDCNAGATYQSLMNHLFQAYLGVFMYVYLDDIVIFSNTVEEHVKHIRIVLSVLRHEKFYLSPKKMQFFAKELKLLGHIIDEKGIRMDYHKVDSIEKWKTPTTKEQVASYIALDYKDNAPPVYLITDASLTGASGVISQGNNWKESNIVQFWSGKFNPAQQNYPVHDREALAIIQSLKKFEHLLQGIPFEILTDHRALEHLVTRKKLSGRQVRWLDVLSKFHFKIRYIEGSENILADGLSRMYSAEDNGVERAISEYVDESDSEIENGKNPKDIGKFTIPVLVGVAAAVAQESGVNSSMVRRNPARN